jgi:hypothetical protein
MMSIGQLAGRTMRPQIIPTGRLILREREIIEETRAKFVLSSFGAKLSMGQFRISDVTINCQPTSAFDIKLTFYDYSVVTKHLAESLALSHVKKQAQTRFVRSFCLRT